MTGRLLRLAVTIALLAAGCGPSGDDNATGGLDGTAWTVVSIAGTSTIAGSRPEISFAPVAPERSLAPDLQAGLRMQLAHACGRTAPAGSP